MNILKKVALATMFASPIASANGFFLADGFITVSTNKVSQNNSVFMYCDAPSTDMKECYDSLFDGNGQVESKKKLSEWREADGYIKHQLGDKFNYIGMSYIGHSIVLYYKKDKETVAKR